MARLVWLLFVLLLSGGSLVGANTPEAAAPIATADGRDAFEQAGDPVDADERSAPFDVDADDDDGDDQGDAFAARTTVLVPKRAVSRSIASFAPQVRASSGHPRGLEEPPRS